MARRIPALLAILLPALAGCAEAGPAGSDLVLAADLGPADAPDAGPDLPAPRDWTLPPCYRACDRLTGCGTDACAGWDWPNAGNLFEACFAACDDAWAATVLDAPGCPEVLAGPAARLAGFESTCATNPCAEGCARFAACLGAECPAIDPLWLPNLEGDCLGWCTPEAAAYVSDTPCPTLVDVLSQNDPAFGESCKGAPAGCPDEPTCAAWSAKLAGCIVDHCAGNADPYRVGLDRLLLSVCRTEPDCPSAASVQAQLAPTVTCDTPGLDTLGRDAPFTAMCEGTLGVTTDQVRLACEHLFPCPGAEWLGSVEGCMGFLAVVEGAGQRVLCLGAAADCTDAYACLEGL